MAETMIYRHSSKKTSKSILYTPENSYAFIGNTSSLVNLEEGLNGKGLAAAMFFVGPNKITPGINSVFLVRYLLEKCATTKEAIKALQSLPIASACNRASADFLISSTLMTQEYSRILPDYDTYRQRLKKQ